MTPEMATAVLATIGNLLTGAFLVAALYGTYRLVRFFL